MSSPLKDRKLRLVCGIEKMIALGNGWGHEEYDTVYCFVTDPLKALLGAI